MINNITNVHRFQSCHQRDDARVSMSDWRRRPSRRERTSAAARTSCVRFASSASRLARWKLVSVVILPSSTSARAGCRAASRV